MRLAPRPSPLGPRPSSAFTMVEIALCLAIIGFGLVAIIGVLPTGLNVQKTNREETIIDQDARVWMDAIRNGAQGLDYLTNYVIGITNYWTRYQVTATTTNRVDYGYDGYDRFGCRVTSDPSVPGSFALTDGMRVIGVLSTPEYTYPTKPQGFQSNYIVACVRALSGAAVDKYPQNDPTILDSAFSYRMVVQNVPYVPVDPEATNFVLSRLAGPVAIERSNYWRVVNLLQANSHSLRLLFRWPLFPNGNVGKPRQTFRLLTGGSLVSTNDPDVTEQLLYFLQPSVYSHP